MISSWIRCTNIQNRFIISLFSCQNWIFHRIIVRRRFDGIDVPSWITCQIRRNQISIQDSVFVIVKIVSRAVQREIVITSIKRRCYRIAGIWTTDEIIVNDIHIRSSRRISSHNVGVTRLCMSVGISIISPVVNNIVHKFVDSFDLIISGFVADVQVSDETYFSARRLHQSSSRMVVAMQTLSHNRILNRDIVRTFTFVVPVDRENLVCSPSE